MASKLKTPNHYVAGKTLGSLLGLCQNQIGGFFLYIQCQDNRKSVSPVFSVRTIERAKHNSLFLSFSLSSDKDKVQIILSSLFLSFSLSSDKDQVLIILSFSHSLFLQTNTMNQNINSFATPSVTLNNSIDSGTSNINSKCYAVQNSIDCGTSNINSIDSNYMESESLQNAPDVSLVPPSLDPNPMTLTNSDENHASGN